MIPKNNLIKAKLMKPSMMKKIMDMKVPKDYDFNMATYNDRPDGTIRGVCCFFGAIGINGIIKHDSYGQYPNELICKNADLSKHNDTNAEYEAFGNIFGGLDYGTWDAFDNTLDGAKARMLYADDGKPLSKLKDKDIANYKRLIKPYLAAVKAYNKNKKS